jgi:hypothetical protein
VHAAPNTPELQKLFLVEKRPISLQESASRIQSRKVSETVCTTSSPLAVKTVADNLVGVGIIVRTTPFLDLVQHLLELW